jgi:hypothetical protein
MSTLAIDSYNAGIPVTTRDGQKIVGLFLNEDAAYPDEVFCGYVASSLESWDRNGHYNGHLDNPMDLVFDYLHALVPVATPSCGLI